MWVQIEQNLIKIKKELHKSNERDTMSYSQWVRRGGGSGGLNGQCFEVMMVNVDL